MHPNTSAKGRWNIHLHQSCTRYLTSNCWAQGLPCQETEGAPWERWKEVLVYWVFRKTCPANNQTCLIVPLGTRRLNCKKKLLEDASSILTCYIAIMLHLIPVVLKRESFKRRQLSSGHLFWGRGFPSHCHMSPGSCQLSPCSLVHMAKAILSS